MSSLLLGFAILLGLTVFIWAENHFSHSFEGCIKGYSAVQVAKNSNQRGILVIFIDKLGTQSFCSIRFVDRHNGFFAALAGLAVAGFTFTLWQSTEKMWRASIEQGEFLETSIVQATRSATAMEGVSGTLMENTNITKEIFARQKMSAEMQLRAYVSIETGQYFRQDRRNHFEFRPNIVNNGQTPASDVTILSKCGLRESADIPADFDYYLDGKNKGLSSKVTLYPHQSKFHSMVFFRRCTFAEMRMLLKGKSVFHLYGHVSYTDAFKEPRRTNFSVVIFVPTNKRGMPVWHSTEHHNDAT